MVQTSVVSSSHVDLAPTSCFEKPRFRIHSKLHVFDDVSMACHIEASTTTSVALRNVMEGELIPHSNLQRAGALVETRLDLGLSSCNPRAYLSTLKAGKVGLLTSSYLGHWRVPFLGWLPLAICWN